MADLSRHNQPQTTRPDPKPAKRIVDPEAGFAKLFHEGRCRICGSTFPLTRHHLVNRSQGGDDVDNNLVPLCGNGTMGCHGLVTERDFETLAALRSRLKMNEILYIELKKGYEWLHKTYPSA